MIPCQSCSGKFRDCSRSLNNFATKINVVAGGKLLHHTYRVITFASGNWPIYRKEVCFNPPDQSLLQKRIPERTKVTRRGSFGATQQESNSSNAASYLNKLVRSLRFLSLLGMTNRLLLITHYS